MRSFFKIFFASLLALIVFSLISVFILFGIGKAISSADKPVIGQNGILVLDLTQQYADFENPSLMISLSSDKFSTKPPSLSDVIRMIQYAKNDDAIKGIYIKAENNPNGYASSEEIRTALEDFKSSGKFIIAYGATMTQKAYYIASVANKVYTNPQGGIDFKGMVSQLMFFKGLLDKLEIEPEVFYAGKFKSATEPFRVTKMTDPNRVQTSVWLGDLFNNFLYTVSKSRNIDTSVLRELSNDGRIQTAADALKYKLVDSLLYQDQVEMKFHEMLKTAEDNKINFITIDQYNKGADYKSFSGKDKIAVVFAQGEITEQKANDQISSDQYVQILSKLRKDNSIKAVVFRINSPGGSSLASEMIWREITLIKKIKPVVISMGDLAASGGYYIACNGSYIFAQPNTITGSIGVFSMTGNAENFFKNKLGITFDEVKTGPYADLGSIARPMSSVEKSMMQASVDSVYRTFTERVADGRHKPISYIDSIAQGRVWTGASGVKIGLVDSLGSLSDAIKYAGKLIHSNNYRISEYPQKKSLFDQIFNSNNNSDNQMKVITNTFGPSVAASFKSMKEVQLMLNTIQTRLPFDYQIK